MPESERDRQNRIIREDAARKGRTPEGGRIKRERQESEEERNSNDNNDNK
jgi:hypothetical protein